MNTPATPIPLSLEGARELDRTDALKSFRSAFELPQSEIYLDGNSLGALPAKTSGRLNTAIKREWGNDLIRSWNINGWYEAPLRVGDKIGRLIGAEPGQVAAADSTSINLYKAVTAALQLRPDRSVILSEPGNFPNDLYMLQGICGARGIATELRLCDAASLCDRLDESVAVLVLTHVHYRTGVAHDMAKMTRLAHEKGAVVVWDLSHSTGAVELHLDDHKVDFAVGCGYKYLNGGPGCPAYIYVAARHLAEVTSPLTGWLGHANPFDFGDDYRPADGIARFLCGSHPVLGLLALEVGVDLMLSASMTAVTEKSQALCDLFISLIDARCANLGLEVITPRAASGRGSHVSLAHPDGYAIVQALIERGVIGDYRAPSVLRFGFTPLYTQYEDVWNSVEILRDVLVQRTFDHARFRRLSTVT